MRGMRESDPGRDRFRNKKAETGLSKTARWVHICQHCRQTTKNHNPKPPSPCQAIRAISGETCMSDRFNSYNEMDLAAMPIGKRFIDMRSPSQLGRKGKVR